MDGTKDNLILDFTRLMTQINSGRGIEEQNDDENDSDNKNGNNSENDCNSENDDNGENDSEYVNGEDTNDNKSGLVYDDYYEESEELTVIQDWN